MTDSQIKEYLIKHNYRVSSEELHKNIIETSPQIINVYYDHIYELITIVTSDNQFIFHEV